MALTQQVIQDGDAKASPYTIAFVANPVLEAPWNSGTFIADTMPGNKMAFDAAVLYAVDCIFGRLPSQAEVFMANPAVGTHVRVVSLRETGLPIVSANALAGESPAGALLAPRRNQIAAYVRSHGIEADVVIVISASGLYTRAAAYGTTDNVAAAGTPFVLDGAANTHWHFPQIPGTAVLHQSARSITPLHEFSHAASSYQSGFIADLYVDGSVEFNRLVGRPIPATFRNYQGTVTPADPTRDGLGYPPGWLSYHCGLIVPSRPAAMDDYTGVTNPLTCRHDEITVAYLTDRLIAKIGR